MLDVNNVLPTLYNDRKMKICRSDGSDRKEQKKIKKRFKTNVLVPKIAVVRKEEGATVAATYLLSGETVRAGLVRAGQAAILHRDIQLYRKPP